MTHEPRPRCRGSFLIWIWSRPFAVRRRQLETSRLCLQGPFRHRKKVTLRSRKRPWPLPGCARSLASTSWDVPFFLNRITSNTKHLDDPPRILRFRLRLAKYNFTAQHIPGKLLYAADALSRAPKADAEVDLQEEAEAYIEHVTIPSLPATSTKLEVYRQAQANDTVCARVFVA